MIDASRKDIGTSVIEVCTCTEVHIDLLEKSL